LRASIQPDRWFLHPEIESLGPRDVQADALLDLRTKGNKLSVFELDGTVDPERIAVAVAAGRQKPDATGYAIFGGAAVEALGIEVAVTKGLTPDMAVNELHRDLDVRTAKNVVALAEAIARGTIQLILGKRVEELLRTGLESAQLDSGKIDPGLRKKLLGD